MREAPGVKKSASTVTNCSHYCTLWRGNRMKRERRRWPHSSLHLFMYSKDSRHERTQEFHPLFHVSILSFLLLRYWEHGSCPRFHTRVLNTLCIQSLCKSNVCLRVPPPATPSLRGHVCGVGIQRVQYVWDLSPLMADPQKVRMFFCLVLQRMSRNSRHDSVQFKASDAVMWSGTTRRDTGSYDRFRCSSARRSHAEHSGILSRKQHRAEVLFRKRQEISLQLDNFFMGDIRGRGFILNK